MVNSCKFMPLLLYCVSEKHSPQEDRLRGVAGSPVLEREIGDLSVFYSESPASDPWLHAPIRDSAVAYHKVLRDLFSRTTIIPFRFPTILADSEELTRRFEARSVEYRALLGKFGGFVQMEAQISHAGSDATAAASGTAYLRERQARKHELDEMVSKLRRAFAARDWRVRSIHRGAGCYALVERSRVAEFNEKMKTLSVPAGLRVRISGPWPVTEFLERNLS